MAQRKKTTTRKKTTRKKARRKSSALARLEEEMPRTLKELSREARRNLTRLERDLEKAGAQTRRRLARLIRDGSHRLGQLEARGEREWRKLGRKARLEAVSVLKRMEKAVAPKPARKKTRRKKTPVRAGSA